MPWVLCSDAWAAFCISVSEKEICWGIGCCVKGCFIESGNILIGFPESSGPPGRAVMILLLAGLIGAISVPWYDMALLIPELIPVLMPVLIPTGMPMLLAPP